MCMNRQRAFIEIDFKIMFSLVITPIISYAFTGN